MTYGAPRFGQLTYTSFDAGGIGGWQVKDHVALSPEEQEVLRTRIDPRLDSGTELPRFPPPDEVGRLPRRLVFGPEVLPSGPAIAWWHHSPAGLDGSGRPGNVFTHVLVDRQPSAGPSFVQPQAPVVAGSVRPIDWWRSPDWLAPYGPEAVRDSRLLPGVPRPGQAVSSAQVIDFLLDVHHYRLGVLSVLVDAVAAALAGGPRVVLATHNTDTAATWIGAVSHLMAEATADRFGFSTLERVGTLRNRFAHGIHVCCVPVADHAPLAELPDRRFVLIAEDEPVELGDLGGHPHTTRAGDRIRVTEWSVLARVVLLDHQTARLALNELDALAVQVRVVDEPDALTGEPAWPLAMLASTHLDLFGDAAREASAVLVRRSPRGLSVVTRLRDSARSVVKATQGSSAGELWEALRRVVVPGQPLTEMAEQLLSVYVAYAIHDAEWLTRPGGPPLPPAPWSTRWAETPEMTGALAGAVDRWDLASVQDVSAACALVGLADLLVRLGVVGEARADRLRDAFDRAVAWALVAGPGEPPLGVSGSELVARLPRVAEPTAALLRSVVNDVLNEARSQGRGAIGRRVPAAVVRWLYPVLPPPLLPSPGTTVEEVLLRAELAYHCVLADPRRFARERPLALMVAWLDGVSEAEVERLLAGPAWRTEELDLVEQGFPGRLPLAVFGPAAKSEPRGGVLDRLLGTLAHHHPELTGGLDGRLGERPAPAHLVRLRELMGQGWWRGQQWFRPHLLDILRGGVWAEELTEVPYDRDVADVLRASCVLAAVSGIGQREAQRLTSGALAAQNLGQLGWTIVSEGLSVNVAPQDLCAAAVLSDRRFPVPQVVSPLHRWVGGVEVVTLTDRLPVLHQCVKTDLAGSRADPERLAPAVLAVLDRVLARADNPDRAERATERFVHSWLRSLAPRTGVFQRLWGER
jgi:hypothetical protein